MGAKVLWCLGSWDFASKVHALSLLAVRTEGTFSLQTTEPLPCRVRLSSDGRAGFGWGAHVEGGVNAAPWKYLCS